MDLEHTNLGHHCDVKDCSQRDFLPFICTFCKHKHCLLHSSANAHNCTLLDSRDMTSIDCPLCGISVKFSKAEKVDEIWEYHYINNCNHEYDQNNATNLNDRKCYKNGCKTVLGLSNGFKCLKCFKEVCLPHRRPEDHDCRGVIRGDR